MRDDRALCGDGPELQAENGTATGIISGTIEGKRCRTGSRAFGRKSRSAPWLEEMTGARIELAARALKVSETKKSKR